MLSFLLAKYLGMEWLDYVVGICLTLANCQIVFLHLLSFYIPMSSVKPPVPLILAIQVLAYTVVNCASQF